MYIMACQNKGAKRRRLESSMSNVSTASAKSQNTEVSLESSNSNTLVKKCSKSQSDVRAQIVLQPRRRTCSSRPASVVYDQEQDGEDSSYPDNQPVFYLGRDPRRHRRNTENSINTEDFNYIHPTATGIHRSITTPCVPGQNTQSFVRTQNTGSVTPLQQYDNNTSNVQSSQRNLQRSQGNISDGHTYMSLQEAIPPQQPVQTVVQIDRHCDGCVRTVIPNGRPLLNSEGSAESQTSSYTSGYCRNNRYSKTKHCCSSCNKALVISIVNSVILASLIVLAVSLKDAQQPEQKPPNCFQYEQVRELIEDPGSSALFRKEELSELYCLELDKVASRTRKEKCRPALELKGTFDKKRVKETQFQWEEDRKSCGLKLSGDKSYIEIDESGLYFLFSRIHFTSNERKSGSDTMVFPVGHALNKNNEPLEEIRQFCRANETFMQHVSVLQTIKGLKKNEKLSIQVESSPGAIVKTGNEHTFGIFKL